MDHTPVGLHAALRALEDVVAPAVDPSSAQARDQLRLVVDYLKFLSQRLDLLPERHRFELAHHLELARALKKVAPRGAAAGLENAITQGETVSTQAGATAKALQGTTAVLAAAASRLVRASGDFEPGVRDAIERVVLRASHDRVAFERAWYLPLGLDPDPHDVTPLSDLLPCRPTCD